MRALVTGATGFIGSYLTERLLGAGAAVAVLVRPTANPWRIADLLPRVTRITGDLRELTPVEREIRDFAPEAVFHLAWHGVAGAQRNDPAQLDANVQTTTDLVRLAVRAGCQTWIGVGSQAEYGPLNRVIAEDAPTEPTTAYGVAKLRAGLAAAELATEAGLRFAWLRVFSTYGPKDSPDWMLPYLIRTLLRGQTPALTGCEQKWDYLYVADAADAIHRVAEMSAAAGVMNLGSGVACPLREVVERVRDLVSPARALQFGAVPYRPDQVMHLQADIARLTRATGWRPVTALDEGLRRTVEWYRSAAAQKA